MQTAIRFTNLSRKQFNYSMDNLRFKLTDQVKSILILSVRISIPGKLKCIQEKLKTGVKLAKNNKKMRLYECSRKLMKESGLINKENSNIF